MVKNYESAPAFRGWEPAVQEVVDRFDLDWYPSEIRVQRVLEAEVIRLERVLDPDSEDDQAIMADALAADYDL